MALLSKSVIEEPKYHGRGHKNTIIYNDLIITVIFMQSCWRAPRFPFEKRFHSKGHLNLAAVVLKGFSPGVSNSHLCNSQYDQLELKFKIRSLN